MSKRREYPKTNSLALQCAETYLRASSGLRPFSWRGDSRVLQTPIKHLALQVHFDTRDAARLSLTSPLSSPPLPCMPFPSLVPPTPRVRQLNFVFAALPNTCVDVGGT